MIMATKKDPSTDFEDIEGKDATLDVKDKDKDMKTSPNNDDIVKDNVEKKDETTVKKKTAAKKTQVMIFLHKLNFKAF